MDRLALPLWTRVLGTIARPVKKPVFVMVRSRNHILHIQLLNEYFIALSNMDSVCKSCLSASETRTNTSL
jgi:hypothetical protein